MKVRLKLANQVDRKEPPATIEIEGSKAACHEFTERIRQLCENVINYWQISSIQTK